MSEVLENLKVARGLLAETGVGRGSVYREGRYCSIGAVAAARTGLRGADVYSLTDYDEYDEDFTPRDTDPYHASWAEFDKLAEFVPEEFWARIKTSNSGSIVYQYNDSLGHTERTELVLGMFDRAIASLEKA